MESEKNQIKAELLKLSSEKDHIEEQIAKLNLEIEKFKHCRFEEKLVDEEGFPREDLDYGKLQEYRLLKKKQNGFLIRTY